MQKRKFLLDGIMFAIIGGLVGWYLYVGQGHVSYTMDSLTYRDVALNILNGNGFVTTNTVDTTTQFFPVFLWPPAYPALWATLASSGIDIDIVPKVLTPLFYIATLVLVYLIGAKLAKSKPAGAIATFLYVAFPSGLAIFNFAWSETLFIPLILSAFFALLKYSAAQDKARVGWLGIAILSIGLANWTRYSGAIFLPLLGFSVLLMTEGSLAKKLKLSFVTTAASMLLVAPLWIRNYMMTGFISGSSRDGYTRIGAVAQLANDIEILWNLVVYPLFGFSTVIYALFGFPLLMLTVYVVWKDRVRILNPDKLLVLTFAWAATNLAFMLYARVVQQGIDFDYRILATTAPFAIVGTVAWLTTEKLKSPQSALLATMVVFMSITLFSEGLRVHGEIVGNSSPYWRKLVFGVVWRDLHKDHGYSKSIRLPAMPNNAVILTDYRGVYMRYLTGRSAYQIVSTENCMELTNDLHVPLVFIVEQTISNGKTPAARCATALPTLLSASESQPRQ